MLPQAHSTQGTEQLAQHNDQLAALRRQQLDEESRRQRQAEDAASQHARTLEALDTLRRAEALLATGDSDGVDELLSQAATDLSGRTRLYVQAAREALSRSDLYPARQYLAAALAQRRTAR